MSIEAAIKNAAKAAAVRSPEIREQLQRNQAFSTQMEAAGVVKRKQTFSIPLMERIAHKA